MYHVFRLDPASGEAGFLGIQCKGISRVNGYPEGQGNPLRRKLSRRGRENTEHQQLR